MPCTMLAFLQNKLLSRYALIPCLIVIALVLYNDEQLFNMLDVDGSLFSGMRDRQVVHEEIDSFCCPRVFIYNSREIEERASAIVGQDMKLTDLDPMNTLTDLITFQENLSIPKEDRIKLLAQLVADMPTQDKASNEDKWNSTRINDISKDYINIFLLRLALSDCVTSDPHEAELFIVPHAIHTSRGYNGSHTVKSKQWETLFSRLNDYQLLLSHFTSESASKHVIFSRSYGHYFKGEGLWTERHLDSRVRYMQRVALGEPNTLQSSDWWQKNGMNLLRPFAYQFRQKFKKAFYIPELVHNVHSVPFCSLLLYPEQTWVSALNNDNRSVLITASHTSNHGQQRSLKRLLTAQCDQSPLCVDRYSSGQYSSNNTLEHKKESVFCLEPVGDWPTRQSIVQDLLLGCIPVFFSPYQQQLWPDLWGDWISEASVVLDPVQVERGRIHVMRYLHSIPPQAVQAMQRSIRLNAQKLVYLHLDQYMQEGHNRNHSCSVDASNLLLSRLRQAAVRRQLDQPLTRTTTAVLVGMLLVILSIMLLSLFLVLFVLGRALVMVVRGRDSNPTPDTNPNPNDSFHTWFTYNVLQTNRRDSFQYDQ